MNLKENALAILNGEQPDLYFDFMDAIAMLPNPYLLRAYPPQDGLEHTDPFGTVLVHGVDAPGAHPHITEANKVIKNIENWREELVLPPVEGLDWSLAQQVETSVNRDERFVCFFLPVGIFERSHFLMGMEDALCNYLTEPEEMFELLKVLKDYKVACIYEAKKHINPDVIFYHDDWGHKTNLFLPPSVWREFIKPLQQEISDAIHDCGMLYMHHSDCFCEPIVEDMVDLGIDIWQGVLPQNDIQAIKKRTQGRLAMIGGLDGAALDDPTMTEEQLRQAVRDALDVALPGGRFFPGIPNGQCYNKRNDEIVKDENIRYGRQWAIEHPVGPVDETWTDDEIREAVLGKVILPLE